VKKQPGVVRVPWHGKLLEEFKAAVLATEEMSEGGDVTALVEMFELGLGVTLGSAEMDPLEVDGELAADGELGTGTDEFAEGTIMPLLPAASEVAVLP
jgi:hypothetical protein